MLPEERIARLRETIERLRADIEWLHASGFYVQSATNDELMAELDRTARLYAAIVDELTRPPG